VDIPAAHFTKIRSLSTPAPKSLTITRIRHSSRMLFFIREDPRQSGAENFLNCTKNIGLTPEHFTRTFTFALTKNSESQGKPL